MHGVYTGPAGPGLTNSQNKVTMAREVNLSEVANVLYLIVKRPDSISKWKGSRLLELQTNQKVMNKIEKYRSERLFVKGSSKRDILCSVMVDEVQKNEDGTFVITFKDIREDHWVLPGAIKSFAGGFAEGPPPIPVPLN